MTNYLILIVVFFSLGCSRDDANKDVKVRIMNSSQYNFQNIVLDDNAVRFSYGNLNTNKESAYHALKSVPYNTAHITIDGRIYDTPIQIGSQIPTVPGWQE